MHSVVMDGIIDRILVNNFENLDLKYLVAMHSKVRQQETKIGILTGGDLSNNLVKEVVAV